jgi:hypothetical protein
MRVQRVVVWQLMNGAVMQTGWWASVKRHGITVDGIDVIHADWCAYPSGCHTSDNNAVFDNAPDGTEAYNMYDYAVSNVRVEGDGVRLLNIVMPPNSTGTIKGISFANVTMDAQSLAGGALTNDIAGSSAGDTVSGVSVSRYSVGGTCVSSANSEQYGFRIDKATTSDITFSCS